MSSGLIQIQTHAFRAKEDLPKPPWLKIRPPSAQFHSIKKTLRSLGLVTVCEEAHCPNISECWSGGTATFMVLGDTCTRGCRFCNVKSGRVGQALDPEEPRKIAEAVARWNLKYVVITSVDRDDLPDQGAGHFAKCILELKQQCPQVLVEVLIPDFKGEASCLRTILSAKPDVVAHNLETVQSLQSKVRDGRAGYEQSLSVLRMLKKLGGEIITKSSLMLGLGESEEEVFCAFQNLRSVSVDVLTLGQYLRPSSWHLPVVEYVSPQTFLKYKEKALACGFLYCASGPFVRSSYRAGELFLEAKLRKYK